MIGFLHLMARAKARFDAQKRQLGRAPTEEEQAAPGAPDESLAPKKPVVPPASL